MSRFARHATLAAALLAGAPLALRAQAPASPPATARIDSTKLVVIRQLVERMQAADQAIAMMEASLPAQRQANPRIPAVFWDRFMAQARARRGELMDLIMVVYDRHFTTDELRQLATFYDSPLGRKLLREQPTVMQESMLAGQQWGARIGQEIGAQLAAEGVTASP